MRDQFPIFKHHPKLIYLDSAATSHKPKRVIDAITRAYKEEYATVHRAIYRPALLATEKYNQTRETAARFLNAKKPEEIVFTKGTTDAINLVALSYGSTFLKPGDEILISTVEHHSNIVPWQMISQKTGATLKWMPIDTSGNLLWENQITPRTKIVSIAHISNVTGTIHPIEQIIEKAHKVDAIVFIDGAQAAPHLKIDVQALDCDFYAFSAHKCYGPNGVGILYGKEALLQKMPPVQGGGDMIEQVYLEKSTYQKPPLRFEAGTPNIASVIAFKAALDFMLEQHLETFTLHGQTLTQRAIDVLSQIPKAHILGSSSKRGPLITFHIEGIHPLDLTTLLDVKNIAIRSGHLCAQPALRFFGLESAVRASFGIYNTLEEVDLFGKTIQDVVEKLCSRLNSE